MSSVAQSKNDVVTEKKLCIPRKTRNIAKVKVRKRNTAKGRKLPRKKKAVSPNTPSYLEDRFFARWKRTYPKLSLQSEYKFHPIRRFRLDFADPETKVGVEINGGIWMAKSGHNSGRGLQADYQKACEAMGLGWAIFPLSADMIEDNHWIDLIAQTILDRQSENQSSILSAISEKELS